MVLEFGYAVMHYFLTWRVEHDELVGVHGDAHIIVTHEAPNFAEPLLEVLEPVELTDFVRGKRHQLGAYAEEENVVVKIPAEYALEAVQVLLYSGDKTLF